MCGEENLTLETLKFKRSINSFWAIFCLQSSEMVLNLWNFRRKHTHTLYQKRNEKRKIFADMQIANQQKFFRFSFFTILDTKPMNSYHYQPYTMSRQDWQIKPFYFGNHLLFVSGLPVRFPNSGFYVIFCKNNCVKLHQLIWISNNELLFAFRAVFSSLLSILVLIFIHFKSIFIFTIDLWLFILFYSCVSCFFYFFLSSQC